MKRIWLLALLLIGCSSIGATNSRNTIDVSKYEVYENVSYYYDQDLHYIVELEDKEYTLDIDNVYFVKMGYVRLHNKFYLGNPNRLVIYNDYH